MIEKGFISVNQRLPQKEGWYIVRWETPEDELNYTHEVARLWFFNGKNPHFIHSDKIVVTAWYDETGIELQERNGK